MSELNSIGLLELSSVAIGYAAEDAMLKAASVELLLARSICSGKFLIAIAGDVASVSAAVEAGAVVASGSLIEKATIARIHPSIFPAISMAVSPEPSELKSLGIIETFSAGSIIAVADAAVKSANVTLLRLHLAMALGGKGFALVTGDVASVEAAIATGAQVAADEGMLVAKAVIAAPSRELFREYI